MSDWGDEWKPTDPETQEQTKLWEKFETWVAKRARKRDREFNDYLKRRRDHGNGTGTTA